MRIRTPILFALSAAMPISTLQARSPQHPPSSFEVASIHVEQNATDGDTEVVIAATGGDDGFAEFTVKSPDGRRVVTMLSLDRTVLGQRELLFESPEPPGDRILASYPEGVYSFKGVTHGGERFQGRARLSHLMPHPTVILSPSADSTVPVGSLLIQWTPVPGVQQYQLELENESADPEQALTFNLPPDASSFEIPAGFLVSGAEYQLGVSTVGENGNVVAVEVTFETE